MPIYEYRCEACGCKSSFLIMNINKPYEVACKFCNSKRMTRLISRVAILRSEESRLERLADPANFAGLDESDPKSIARWMKRMGKELGEDLGEDFDAMVDEAIHEAEVESKPESKTESEE